MKFLKNKKNNKSKSLPAGRQGFTMIELVVALAIFIVVITLVFGLFINSLKGYRRAIASQNVQDNARFLLGLIAKEIKMSDINSVSSNVLDIIDQEGSPVVYSFNGTDQTIERNNNQINSQEVSVTGNFSALGIGLNNDQVRVTISLKVETTDPDKADIVVQTTISPRNIEL